MDENKKSKKPQAKKYELTKMGTEVSFKEWTQAQWIIEALKKHGPSRASEVAEKAFASKGFKSHGSVGTIVAWHLANLHSRGLVRFAKDGGAR